MFSHGLLHEIPFKFVPVLTVSDEMADQPHLPKQFQVCCSPTSVHCCSCTCRCLLVLLVLGGGWLGRAQVLKRATGVQVPLSQATWDPGWSTPFFFFSSQILKDSCHLLNFFITHNEKTFPISGSSKSSPFSRSLSFAFK